MVQRRSASCQEEEDKWMGRSASGQYEKLVKRRRARGQVVKRRVRGQVVKWRSNYIRTQYNSSIDNWLLSSLLPKSTLS